MRIVTDKGDHVDVTYEDPSYNPEKLYKAALLARYVTLFLFVRRSLRHFSTIC